VPSAFRPAFASIAAALLAAALPLSAFQSALSDESVREAYFLGQRNNETTSAFFAPYLKTLAPPKSGPYVSEVEVYTPYIQVIETSRLNTVGYSAQQAAREYHSHAVTIFVRVRIDFTSTYGALELYRSGRLDQAPKAGSTVPTPDFGHDFRVGLSQRGGWVEPLSIQLLPASGLSGGHVAFSPYSGPTAARPKGEGYYRGGGRFCLIGWQVWLEYDARDVVSDDALIEVFTTDGQHITVPFDLQRLR
jgi:hypothetical protein